MGLANELSDGLRRGDFITWRERMRARWILWHARREAAAKYPPSPEERQARAAEHSAVAAYLALAVSLLSLVLAYLAYTKTP